MTAQESTELARDIATIRLLKVHFFIFFFFHRGTHVSQGALQFRARAFDIMLGCACFGGLNMVLPVR